MRPDQGNELITIQVMSAQDNQTRFVATSTPLLQCHLYLTVPQEERIKLCKYLFGQDTCPHQDLAFFVYRLHVCKQRKGDGRSWTSDEHELLHIIRETSHELMHRLGRERTKTSLILAIDSLFDALDDEMTHSSIEEAEG